MASNERQKRQRSKATIVAGETTFDPYYKWLGIPPKDQPPNHYRLLALDLFESDTEVIDAAANRQMAYLQQRAIGKHAAISQKLLNEIATARLCLLNPQKKTEYDAGLKARLASQSRPPSPTTAVPKSTEPLPNQHCVPTTSAGRSPRLPLRRKTLLAAGCCLVVALVLIAVLRWGHPRDTTTEKPVSGDVAQGRPSEDPSPQSPGTMLSTGAVEKTAETTPSPVAAESHAKKLIPAGGWPTSAEMAVFRVDHTGGVPAPDAVPRYLFGKANRKMRNWPTFLVNSQGESSLDLMVHAVQKAGAVLDCFVDGSPAERFEFPDTEKVSYPDQTYRIAIPSGQHEIQLRNTGKGWIHIYWYRFQGRFADPM